jgi:hypothetical protein
MVSRTLIRDLADRSRVVVHLQLRERGDTGGLSPAFSVTTDRYEPHGTHSGKRTRASAKCLSVVRRARLGAGRWSTSIRTVVVEV